MVVLMVEMVVLRSLRRFFMWVTLTDDFYYLFNQIGQVVSVRLLILMASPRDLGLFSLILKKLLKKQLRSLTEC
ncbi:Polyadenylate-binding protein 8 [Bienertia sinuspersici]